MLLNDTHKLELLKIVEQNPSDIALLLDYLEKELKCFPSDLEGEDKEALKFFVIKSYADEISSFHDELLEELEKVWQGFFDEKLNQSKKYSLTIEGKTYRIELDLGKIEDNIDNYYPPLTKINDSQVTNHLDQDNAASMSNVNISLKEKITLEQLNNLLSIRYNNLFKIYRNDLLKMLSSPEFEIMLPPVNQEDELLFMKAFSIGDKSILNNFRFANAIIYLTGRFDQEVKADYSCGLALCVSDGVIIAIYITA